MGAEGCSTVGSAAVHSQECVESLFSRLANVMCSSYCFQHRLVEVLCLCITFRPERGNRTVMNVVEFTEIRPLLTLERCTVICFHLYRVGECREDFVDYRYDLFCTQVVDNFHNRKP